MGMSEPSISNAGRCNGSRYSVDCLSHLITRYFRQPPFKEVVYGTTLLFNKSVIAVRMIIKVAPVTYKGKKMKRILILMFCCTTIFMVGCSASKKVEVTAYSTLNRETEKIQTDMSVEGYELVNVDKSEDGERKTDRYCFKKANGESFEYAVAYDLRDYEEIQYVKDVKLNGCKVSNGSDFSRLCGTDAQVRQIENLPQDTTVKEFSPGKLVFNLVGLPAIILGGLYTVLLVVAAAAR